ncbi:DUF1361 domain-containing protein [Zunongwangia sp. F363]|uniref:DUF1361 domain-containing protein n=1 Tax=Autumnicola tepida TaxID=3075595 RepID=A0ABU3CA43_9FLAO|nr:DUF1361 domain-containing protein [Zunongwangia sp. F363]MDT0643199.1 DUF1361 domain-containing protein [Zunongwangia sp. F363]
MKISQHIINNKELVGAGGFCCSLVVLRWCLTLDYYYFFLIWNLFLAGVPFLISQYLETRNNRFFYTFFGLWLLFLPNSFYVITDLIHVKTSQLPVYDAIMISLFALLCLYLGFSSMQKTGRVLSLKFQNISKLFLDILILFLCSFGIYLGRFLRYNSWDILKNPFNLAQDCFNFVRFPVEHFHVWFFTFGFGILLMAFILFSKN